MPPTGTLRVHPSSKSAPQVGARDPLRGSSRSPAALARGSARLSPANVLSVQQSAGNRAVSAALAGGAVAAPVVQRRVGFEFEEGSWLSFVQTIDNPAPQSATPDVGQIVESGTKSGYREASAVLRAIPQLRQFRTALLTTRPTLRNPQRPLADALSEILALSPQLGVMIGAWQG